MKRFRLFVAAGFAALALGACTPQHYIHEVFGGDGPAAESVAWCESGMNPNAVSSGGGNHGLFQINSVHRGAFEAVTGQPWGAVYDPYWNAVFAKHLYSQSGWQPWGCKP